MSVSKLLFTYSLRLITRQWRRFVLPLLSLTITALVLLVVLMLTSASSLLLSEQARELQGGDVVLESNYPVATEEFWAGLALAPTQSSEQLKFSGTLESDSATAPVSIRVVDKNFPLYGEMVLQTGAYRGVADDEILLDAAGAEKLAVVPGAVVRFGGKQFTVAGIIQSEPTSLFGGFRFLPSGIMSQSGFTASGVDLALLRAEYIYAYSFAVLTAAQKTSIRDYGETFDRALHVDIAGEDSRGLQFGLQTVADFLIVAVLITAVLAAVNVYASTVYLITVERKSLAILLALGLPKRSLTLILGLSLGYTVIAAGVVGSLLGGMFFTELSLYIARAYFITLPTPSYLLNAGISVLLIGAIALAAFLPAVKRSLALNPRQILSGGEGEGITQVSVRSFARSVLAAFLPLTILAAFLLMSVWQGVLVMSAIALVYILIAGLFAILLGCIYQKRQYFGFFIRSLISQKKADGLFGIISFTSLFVALGALGTLVLLHSSIQNFLVDDLARTIPSTYVLDVQPSQSNQVVAAFPELELFSNVGARIVAIDGLRIQDELAKADSTVDRELGREFNLTARAELLVSEKIVAGTWSGGRPGEISVDEEFAEQANIELGSTIEFLIQGFPVVGTVTSLRSTDSRSGLPFFYFVMSPEDVGQFPAASFGYAYYGDEKQAELGRFLAHEMPNVSMIETQDIGPLLETLIGTLMLMIAVVTLPPLLIATLLIATLIVSSYAARRREGARLRALGASRNRLFWYYVLETLAVTVAASTLALLSSVAITYGVGVYYLGLDSTVWFALELVFGFGLIIVMVGGLAWYLFKTDTLPLRELLSYETST